MFSKALFLIPKHLFQFRIALSTRENKPQKCPGTVETYFCIVKMLWYVMVQVERSHALAAADGAVQ